MTDSDLLQLRSWIDIAIKALIGVVVSIVGMDYRNLKNSLEELEQSKYRLTMQVEVLQSQMGNIKESLDKIDRKLDKALVR